MKKLWWMIGSLASVAILASSLLYFNRLHIITHLISRESKPLQVSSQSNHSNHLITRSIPVYAIPSVNGYDAGYSSSPVASHISLSLPRQKFFSDISAISFNGKIYLIPAGWGATGGIGTDGSGGLSAFPTGHGSNPRGGFPQLVISQSLGYGDAAYSVLPFFSSFRQSGFSRSMGISVSAIPTPTWYGESSSTGMFVVPATILGAGHDLATFKIVEPNTGDITQGVVFAPVVDPYFNYKNHPGVPEAESIILTIPVHFPAAVVNAIIHYDAHALGIPSFPI